MDEDSSLPIRGQRSPLLGTEALRNHLGGLLARPPSRLLIVSAYVTRVGVEWLARQTSSALIDCDIIARWSPSDLLSGASDAEACRLAMARGWRFHVLPDLHAKVALVDETDIVVGSANLTGAGMKLVPASNREFGVAARATPKDVLACRGLLGDAVRITPELLEDVSVWVAKNKKPPRGEPVFPAEIRERLRTVPTRLFTAELPWLSGADLLSHLTGPRDASGSAILRHDLALLGLDRVYDEPAEASAAVSASLETSRFWSWLVHAVRRQPNGQVWYGGITSLLHDALCDDPRPYRQDVKVLVSNLYSYAEIFGCGLQADRPNHSQRLTIA